MFEYFLNGDGEHEINFRVPYSVAKHISISELTYEIDDDMLIVEGNYVLKANFELALDENAMSEYNDVYKDFEYDELFRVEINRQKK